MNDQQMAASLEAIVANEEEDFVGTRNYVRSAQLTAAALRQVVTVYETRFADPYLVQAINNITLAGTQNNQDPFLCCSSDTGCNFMQAAQAADHPLQFNVYEVPCHRLSGDQARHQPSRIIIYFRNSGDLGPRRPFHTASIIHDIIHAQPRAPYCITKAIYFLHDRQLIHLYYSIFEAMQYYVIHNLAKSNCVINNALFHLALYLLCHHRRLRPL